MATGFIARRGDRALAYVRCGKKIRLVRGHIATGSPDTFSDGAQAGRYGDRVSLGCGKSGRVTGAVARDTIVNSRGAALRNSRVTGPGILRGWIASSGKTVVAG